MSKRGAQIGHGEARASRSAGFTLIEMLVVLAVFGILLLIALPKLAEAFKGAKVRGAVSQFVSAHGLARATALRYGRVAELHIDAANTRFWVEVDTSQVGGVNDTVGTVHNVAEAQLVMTSDRSLVCFDGRGLATTLGACEAGNVTVVFSLAGRTDTVNVSSLGKVLR